MLNKSHKRLLDTFKRSGFFYGAVLYAFMIPFSPKLTTISLILWVFLALMSFDTKALVKQKYLLVLPIFYLSYFMGVFTSSTPSFQFLEYKLSLLIFPLVFSLHSYNERHRTVILRSLVLGLVVAGLFCLAMAFYKSCEFSGGSWNFKANVLEGRAFMESILYGGNYFFGKHFSVFHQTVYFALYLCTGLAVLLWKPLVFGIKMRIGIGTFFVLLLFLISNKASFLVLGVLLLFHFIIGPLRIVKKVLGLLVVLVLMVFFVMTNPRTKDGVKKVVNGELAINKNARYGFGPRILSWDAAIILIGEKPLWGYGLGDTQKELNETYQDKHYKFPFQESFNAHNLWLQTWLENGLVGMVVLLVIFIVLFRNAFSSISFSGFVACFALIFLINSMFESMFSRFSGISFLSFMICFVLSRGSVKEKG